MFHSVRWNAIVCARQTKTNNLRYSYCGQWRITRIDIGLNSPIPQRIFENVLGVRKAYSNTRTKRTAVRVGTQNRTLLMGRASWTRWLLAMFSKMEMLLSKLLHAQTSRTEKHKSGSVALFKRLQRCETNEMKIVLRQNCFRSQENGRLHQPKYWLSSNAVDKRRFHAATGNNRITMATDATRLKNAAPEKIEISNPHCKTFRNVFWHELTFRLDLSKSRVSGTEFWLDAKVTCLSIDKVIGRRSSLQLRCVQPHQQPRFPRCQHQHVSALLQVPPYAVVLHIVLVLESAQLRGHVVAEQFGASQIFTQRLDAADQFRDDGVTCLLETLDQWLRSAKTKTFESKQLGREKDWRKKKMLDFFC